ncbi:MAG: hypothetical protein K9K86_04275 [Pseudomonadales bacterium]|nr:hypothetical protein [Pseudomonadales bacterium]
MCCWVAKYSLLAMLGLWFAGCSTTMVKTTDITPLDYATKEVAEHDLLDIGVLIFDPGIDELLADKKAVTLPEIRRAESRYIPYTLTETLQKNGSWGAVRVIPSVESVVDVYVSGKILHSDGERLTLEISVRDVQGQTWFKREYEEMASEYSYDEKKHKQLDPFQGIYNRIANDLLAYRNKLKEQKLKDIRMVSEMKFAQSFSEEAFAEYMTKDKSGYYQLVRLPPDNDPLLQRVRSIRERDYLYIDTLQDYYSSFALEMEKPYREWRKMTYNDVVALRELRREARNRMIAGAAMVLAGVAAAGGGDGSTRAAGQVGVLGGAYMIKSGLDKRAESQIHQEALQELGGSFEAEVEPQVIELEDRTVTLTGTVDNQYNQWRGILYDIYMTETGGMPAKNQ